MTATLASIILDVRAEVNDTTTSHLVRQEVPLGAINSSNKVYSLAYFPLVASASVFPTVDGVLLTAGFTVDLPKGKITFTTAPTTSLTVDYYFYVFVDADITVWIQHGMQSCGYGGNSDIPTLPDPMSSAVEHIAISMACSAWSRKYAEGFSWTVGPETVDKKDISAHYLELSKDAYKTGIEMRDDYYKRYGKRNAPAFDVLQFNVGRYDVIR